MISLLIGLVGIAAGASFLVVGIRSSQENADQRFDKVAAEIFGGVQSTWTEFSIAALWIHQTCHGEPPEGTAATTDPRDGEAAATAPTRRTPSKSIGCTRHQYDVLYEYITNSGLILDGIFWMSNVTHSERDALEQESRRYYAGPYPNVTYLGIVEVALNAAKTYHVSARIANKSWYFPLHYVLPVSTTGGGRAVPEAQILDYDFSSSPTMWPLIDAAIRQGTPRLSWRLPKNGEYTVQMYHPGLPKNNTTRTTTTTTTTTTTANSSDSNTDGSGDNTSSSIPTDEEYNGVAAVSVRIYDLLYRATKSKIDNLDVYIYDQVPNTDAEDEDNFGTIESLFMSGIRIRSDMKNHTATPNRTVIEEIDKRSVEDSSYKYRETVLQVEDRQWLVLVSDPNNTYQKDIIVPVTGCVIIVLVALIIAVWFYKHSMHTAEQQRKRVQDEVEKAALLEEMNKKLCVEVEQRLAEIRETERLASEKTKLAKDAEARSESMIQTMSMLSHELRTPLQGIMGITSMALNEDMMHSHRPHTPPVSPTATPAAVLTSPSPLIPGRGHGGGGGGGEGGSSSASAGNHPEGKHISDDSTTTSASFSSASGGTKSSDTIDPSMKENLYTIHASSQQLLTLINNLLDIKKLGAGMMESFDVECFNLQDVVCQCVDTLKPLSSLSDVSLNIKNSNLSPGDKSDDLRNTMTLVKSSVLPVQQVLINLVGNAIKYSAGASSLSSFGEGKTSIDISIRRSTIDSARREAHLALCSSEQSEGIVHGTHVNKTRSSNKDVLIVDVRDRGAGIPINEAKKVFAAFMMLKKHSSKRKDFAQPIGTGLGLQLCMNMVERMGGYIWANNCSSQQALEALRAAGANTQTDTSGCVFSFCINCPSTSECHEFTASRSGRSPMLVDISPSNNVLDFSENHVVDGVHHGGSNGTNQRRNIPSEIVKIKALVVDDILLNVKVISRMLRGLGLHNVRCATSGEKALEMLLDDPDCDLILTDYQMPGLDGLGFASKAKILYSEMKKPSPLIALCTADYSPSVLAQCAKAGIEGMLRKPVTVPDLSRFIEEYRSLD